MSLESGSGGLIALDTSTTQDFAWKDELDQMSKKNFLPYRAEF